MIVSTLSFIGCTLKTVDTSETGVEKDGISRILIATQKTKYKRVVVSEIKGALENNSFYIKVIDVKKLRNESTHQYNAIIIINRCIAGRPDPRVESFIVDVREKNKIVLLTTGIMDSWKPDSPEIDAMTSASKLDDSRQIAQTIVGKVLDIINKQKI
jgi:hypothetical protein